MKLGQTIRELRKQQKWSQKQCAEVLNITQSYLSLVEGDHKTPSPALLSDMSIAFKTPYPVLLWKTLDIYDVPEQNRDYFKWIQPVIDKMLDQLFT